LVADLTIERELMPVPLRLATDQAMARATFRKPEVGARITDRAEHAEQGLLRIAPAPVAADQIAVGRAMAAAAGELVGRAFRLRVNLHAHITAHPVIATTGPAQRPAIETLSLTEISLPRAGPAGVDLDISRGLLLRLHTRCLQHRLHVGRTGGRRK